MSDTAVHFSTILMAFFAIMNPIANTPVFLGLTDGLSDSDRRLVAIRGIILAFVIITAFSLGGQTIFNLFGITLPAFRITGGILVGLVGYHMLQGEHSSVHSPNEDDTEPSREAAIDLSISPLALPILAGPGSIATAMSFSAGSGNRNLILTLVALAIICAISLVSFLAGEQITRFLGPNALKVITRLMGLILAVIGVQMLIEGIQGVDWS
ncbi:MAG: MarC family protein [Verrucomicrobiota bacterium]